MDQGSKSPIEEIKEDKIMQHLHLNSQEDFHLLVPVSKNSPHIKKKRKLNKSERGDSSSEDKHSIMLRLEGSLNGNAMRHTVTD